MLLDRILKSGQSLEHFQSRPLQVSLFKESAQDQIPSLFKQLQIDQTHKIKYFAHDPQANIRVFYFQYLKLCFESQNSNPSFYINRIEDLILNEDFQFILEEQLSQQQVQKLDLQYKRLILQFFQYLQEDNKSVEQALSIFPIMDTIFISFFRTLLISMDLAQNYSEKIEPSSFYEFLISYFGIETSSFKFCIKFKDTNIYVYEEKDSQIFIAYSQQMSNRKITSNLQDQQNEEQSSVLEGSGPDFFLKIFGNKSEQNMQVREPEKNLEQAYIKQAKQFNSQYSLKDLLVQNSEKQRYQQQKLIIKHAKTSSGSLQPPSDLELDKNVSTQFVNFNNVQIHWNNLEDIDDDETIHINCSRKDVVQQSVQIIQSQTNVIRALKNQQHPKRIQKYSYKAQKVQTEPTPHKYNKKQKSIKNDQSNLISNSINKQNYFFMPQYYFPKQTTMLSFSKKQFLDKKIDKKQPSQDKEIKRLKQKINITQQFTKTFILKQLRQPVYMNVAKMKQRSRISRDNFLKNWICRS